MSEREKILGRIREALRYKAKPLHQGPELVQPFLPHTHTPREWLPAVGAGFDDRVTLFGKNAVDLKAAFHLVKDTAELSARLASLKQEEAWKTVASHRGELTDAACAALALPTLQTDVNYDVKALERVDVGITECDALIAQTGSVLVTSRSAGGRALSVLPPHHVVLARRTQLIRDLPEAFDLLNHKYGSNFPSFISLISGPSRTGDIERILVLGAHGPKKLTILCL